MVNLKAQKPAEIPRTVEPTELPEDELRWCTVSLNEVLQQSSRLEASVFDIEGKHAREALKRCKWPIKAVSGQNGLADCYHRPRFKRIWVEKSDLPIYQPSQITEINPKPTAYLSSLTGTDIDTLRVNKGQLLLTCSGTIGNCTYVGNTLNDRIFSHDVIRITCKNEIDSGYLYAFFKTMTGQALIRSNEYGAVVSHIEPEHLEHIPIPDPPYILKKRIHDLVIHSYILRDESNAMLEQAKSLLYDALKLPPIEKLRPHYFAPNVGLRNYAVRLSRIDGRLDASYHVPIVDAILSRLEKEAAKITTIGDPRICKRIILPGRFARVYMQEGQGTVFFGGKQLYELDPANKKYLSFTKHGDRIKRELLLKENTILITRSGTIGKVALVPAHWEKWVVNEHIIRVEPASPDIAGYLFVFLSSEYGHQLIKRYTYGAVVDEIDDRHVSQVAIPLLKDLKIQTEINRLALKANTKRTEAYNAEQEAILITNENVIHAT